ncbi:MAG: AAC(3) family N-acetyltransferase [Acidimicrobiales bacterium]|nr:AAC(3) family N-acetyltransferase [Acidimicrobiales bacterium]
MSKQSGEALNIVKGNAPITAGDVTAALHAVGVEPGGVIIVHSSMSRLGWFVGGAISVVHGVLDAVGDDGTVVMPAQTGMSDPSTWVNPPVPEGWWPTIRAEWPAFDPQVTPLRAMGAVVETFRRTPDVVHSGHPTVGFVARGPAAAEIVAGHSLTDSLGEHSPLARLYDAGARIVLLGVGHANNTSLHLCEHRAEWPGKQTRQDAAPMLVDGERQWVTYDDLDRDDADFPALGEAFVAASGAEARVPLGVGHVNAYDMAELVDFGVRWINENRGGPSVQ